MSIDPALIDPVSSIVGLVLGVLAIGYLVVAIVKPEKLG